MCGTRGRVSNFEAPQTLIYLPNQCYARKQQQAKMDAWALRGGPTRYVSYTQGVIDGHRQPKRDPKNRTNPPSTFCPSWHPRFGFERGGEEEEQKKRKTTRFLPRWTLAINRLGFFPRSFSPGSEAKKEKTTGPFPFAQIHAIIPLSATLSIMTGRYSARCFL